LTYQQTCPQIVEFGLLYLERILKALLVILRRNELSAIGRGLLSVFWLLRLRWLRWLLRSLILLLIILGRTIWRRRILLIALRGALRRALRRRILLVTLLLIWATVVVLIVVVVGCLSLMRHVGDG
jgi:hypothetical protein